MDDLKQLTINNITNSSLDNIMEDLKQLTINNLTNTTLENDNENNENNVNNDNENENIVNDNENNENNDNNGENEVKEVDVPSDEEEYTLVDPFETISKTIVSLFDNIFIKGFNKENKEEVPTPEGIPPKEINEPEQNLQEYNNMMKKEKKIKRKRQKREDKIITNTNIWLNDILPNWKKKRHSYHIKILCWDGIPPKIREKVWRRAIGNSLKITKEMYDNMKINVENIKKNTNKENNENTVHLIHLDLPRTFPALSFFSEGTPLHTNLKNILEAYVSFCPEVGYVQGMSYIVAMILLNIESEYRAFVTACNLFNRDIMKTFYSVNIEKMESFFQIFDKAILEYLPTLHQHLKKLEIAPILYCLDWIITLYSKSLPINIATRVWDIFLFEGDYSLIHIALGILSLLEKKIIKRRL